MIHIKGDIVIDRPVEDVFDYVADECNEPTYNTQMRLAEKISDGPIAVGTQYRAEVVSGGRPVSMVIEFTEYERPRRLASKTTMSSMDIAYTLTFEQVREGTRMGWSGEIEPHGSRRRPRVEPAARRDRPRPDRSPDARARPGARRRRSG